MEFTVENWQQHECVRERPAIERDVQEGRAVFYVPGSNQADVYPIDCPAPGILHLDGGSKVSVIIVQAQRNRESVTLGMMDQQGNHYVSTNEEVVILDDSTEEWRAGLEGTE